MSRILLGVGGGIAAYKVAALLRRFTETGHEERSDIQDRHACFDVMLKALNQRYTVCLCSGDGDEASVIEQLFDPGFIHVTEELLCGLNFVEAQGIMRAMLETGIQAFEQLQRVPLRGQVNKEATVTLVT